MNKLKTILIKGSAIFMLLALVSLNLNIDSFPNIDWDQITITASTQSAQAQCPLCPDPEDMYMKEETCPEGYIIFKCVEGGNGCDVEDQTTCENPIPIED